MENNLNTAFKIHQEIYNIKKQIIKKKSNYSSVEKCIEKFKNDIDFLNNLIAEINISIRAIDNYLNFNSDTSYNTTLYSIRKDYNDKLQQSNDEIVYAKNNIHYFENDLTKIKIELFAYDEYIENLYKMITRINRWSNIKNANQYELDIEAFRNHQNFEMQLSLINDPPPKLERH